MPARSMRDLYERVREADDRTPVPGVEPQPGSGAASLPLVGRNGEWARLVAAWHTAAAGHPQLILLTGEAGIGKTRLAEELCGWVARQGATVAAARCYPEGAGVTAAYAPVAEWLRGDALRTRVTTLDDVWLVEIARILPVLLAERPHLAAPGPLTEAWQRTRLFEALARGVLGSSGAGGARRPLLLFLDDLQWCDQETLDWLGYLLRFAATAPLLVVATARKYEVDKLHPLMAFWLGLTRSGLLDEVLLSPLDANETGLLAANVAGRAIDALEASEIYTDTEGNPLFVVETVRAEMANEQSGRMGDRSRYVERGTSPVIPATPSFSHGTLPTKVRAVIQWRLAQLSPAARALAQVASVIGRTFDLEVLARAAGQDEAGLVEGLDELWRSHLVRLQGGNAYDFSHDGIRAVAYDDTGRYAGAPSTCGWPERLKIFMAASLMRAAARQRASPRSRASRSWRTTTSKPAWCNRRCSSISEPRRLPWRSGPTPRRRRFTTTCSAARSATP